MTREWRIILSTALLFILSRIGPSLCAQQSAPASSTAATIQMTAKKYEFDPAVITVKQGDQVKLVITATDRDHGIKLAAYDIDQRLEKGVPTTVEFRADKAGTFPFECSVVCGIGHHRMKGKLVVEPASGSASTSNP